MSSLCFECNDSPVGAIKSKVGVVFVCRLHYQIALDKQIEREKQLEEVLG